MAEVKQYQVLLKDGREIRVRADHYVMWKRDGAYSHHSFRLDQHEVLAVAVDQLVAIGDCSACDEVDASSGIPAELAKR